MHLRVSSTSSRLSNQGHISDYYRRLWCRGNRGRLRQSDAEQDLITYSTQFNLPSCSKANGCFYQVFANGVRPPNDPGNWSLEEALDIEMAHAMAPNAKIILVEAAS